MVRRMVVRRGGSVRRWLWRAGNQYGTKHGTQVRAISTLCSLRICLNSLTIIDPAQHNLRESTHSVLGFRPRRHRSAPVQVPVDHSFLPDGGPCADDERGGDRGGLPQAVALLRPQDRERRAGGRLVRREEVRRQQVSLSPDPINSEIKQLFLLLPSPVHMQM